jgi:hypothetical protein
VAIVTSAGHGVGRAGASGLPSGRSSFHPQSSGFVRGARSQCRGSAAPLRGQITDSLTLSPPPSTLDCPGGQRAVLASVSYTNVSVSEPAAGTQTIPGTFSRVFFTV